MQPLSKENRIATVIAISSAFFLVEIVIGFRNHSLALVADAFHVASDLIGFVVALIATQKRNSSNVAPQGFTFGWQRAELLGGFFNGVFLLALGVSILLQTIERFLSPVKVTQPKWVLITGAIGLGLNALSAAILGGHGHDHGDQKKADDAPPPNAAHHHGHAHTVIPARHKEHADLGILGVLIHLIGDAINNVAVMVSAGILMATGFVYADPLASAFVGVMIVGTSLPLVLRTGRILLDSAPMPVEGVGQDILKATGVEGLHEMHVWSLTQSKALATVHVATSNDSVTDFMASAKRINECLHHWGIHNTTIQPELVQPSASLTTEGVLEADRSTATARGLTTSTCQLRCPDVTCRNEVCCDTD
ncbi:cation efflux protein [Punctularia strigosozonata HHB-11173 SS5]|uniref:cation efflux protein n=1 Tax=Punctularia strigosozonata (strain HHB-11173) TaxID=741275 RepID=UPI0004416C11|nr:cation efflux protein [Punctularia strigosozonata HHB-11173 SS5]EIN11832.1 cation efflux protein [Punctularia strigosozonata HHB-11173 SS5]